MYFYSDAKNVQCIHTSEHHVVSSKYECFLCFMYQKLNKHKKQVIKSR